MASSSDISVVASSSQSLPAPVCGPSQGRQSLTSFSNSNPSHRLLLFMNCSSVNIFPQEKAVPVWILHMVTHPASNPAPPLSRASQVLPGAYSSAMGSQLPLGIHLLCVRSSMHCRGLTMLFTMAAAPPCSCLIVLITVDCSTTLALAPGAPPLPPALT